MHAIPMKVAPTASHEGLVAMIAVVGSVFRFTDEQT